MRQAVVRPRQSSLVVEWCGEARHERLTRELLKTGIARWRTGGSSRSRFFPARLASRILGFTRRATSDIRRA
jgi:hypothetical protein